MVSRKIGQVFNLLQEPKEQEVRFFTVIKVRLTSLGLELRQQTKIKSLIFQGEPFTILKIKYQIIRTIVTKRQCCESFKIENEKTTIKFFGNLKFSCLLSSVSIKL